MGQEQSSEAVLSSLPRKKSSVVSNASHRERLYSQSGRSGSRSGVRAGSRTLVDLLEDVEGDVSFVDLEKFASSFKPRKYSHFQPFIPRNLCKLCHMISDQTGSTELVTPCGCDGTSLLVHEICLESWLKSSGKVRCEACKTDYGISNIEELRAELMVQKVNFCLIAVFMPVGVVVIVGACIIMDSISRARAKAAVAGIPVEGIGIPMDRFVIYCIILGSLTLVGLIKTISMMKRKKLKTLDNLTAIGNEA